MQAILDKHGLTLVEIRNARRRTGVKLEAVIEISTALKVMGMKARNRGRILNCDEWLARYYSNPKHRLSKRRADLARIRKRKTSPPNHTERKLAEGPQVESVI